MSFQNNLDLQAGAEQIRSLPIAGYSAATTTNGAEVETGGCYLNHIVINFGTWTTGDFTFTVQESPLVDAWADVPKEAVYAINQQTRADLLDANGKLVVTDGTFDQTDVVMNYNRRGDIAKIRVIALAANTPVAVYGASIWKTGLRTAGRHPNDDQRWSSVIGQED